MLHSTLLESCYTYHVKTRVKTRIVSLRKMPRLGISAHITNCASPQTFNKYPRKMCPKYSLNRCYFLLLLPKVTSLEVNALCLSRTSVICL